MTLPGHSAPIAPLRPADLAGALAWWRDAGVDCDFLDEPRGWLAKPEAAATAGPAAFVPLPPPPPPEPERIGGKAGALPATLAEFSAWWLTEPTLDGGIAEGRVPPRGPANAALMVLVPHPESDDAERLLGGPQGQLLDAILTALRIGPDSVYVAACLPRHMPLPDWHALQAAGLGDVVAHHIALAAPRRLLLLGSNISSLLGHDPAKTGIPFAQFNYGGAMGPALAAPGLDILGTRPRGKARLWQALLDWTGAE